MFDPKECERLAREMAEDDERATPGNWHAADCISPQVMFYAVPKDKAKLRTVGEGDLLYLGRVYADGKGQGRRNLTAIARLRNNARAASEQLRAAVEEVERVGELYRDELHRNHGADRDRLAAECERLTAHVSLVETREKQATEIEELEWLVGRIKDGAMMNPHANHTVVLLAALDKLLASGGEAAARAFAERIVEEAKKLTAWADQIVRALERGGRS